MNNDARHPESSPDLRMLSAFVDNELSENDTAAVREHLERDEQAAAQVAAWRAQKQALRALCGATTRDDTQFVVLRSRSSWWQRAGIAACWLVAGAGLALGAAPLVPRLVGGDTMSFARRADIAYAVYTPERRHPVEVAAVEEEHLIAWLSKRLNRQLSVPSLQEYGYSLVGGRLLPGEAGPAAQFMYENQTGARLTLYVTGVPKDETAFRLFRDGNRRTFYWVNDGMGYALSGPIAEGKLRTIAIDVCSALGGRPEAWQ
ncbi:anti-sigma factor [Paraburkholderia sp. SARCC-3016]|uniref:anti-sigma factor family protein n=1 Tax=Paraburkholderia sp. SARCC-3016 TaxID=3058611 RepID=UPI00280968A7|nr:anti-sigma factor [Paraburkholderia sp. SARCC-3016]MDQ7977914.1 anti-sigma factor [Paraburkholderia sp. SARCC-3016]